MAYYSGNLDADLAMIQNEPFVKELDEIGSQIGYGRSQQILQILWAKKRRDQGLPTVGAFGPKQGT